MNLKEILSISGKPGLFKLISQSRTGVIVESLLDNKRFPVRASQNVSTLGDIAIYTYGEEEPLAKIFKAIAAKEDNKPTIDPKSSGSVLTEYFGEILPEFDRERVYTSDIKKVLSWYNILQKNDMLSFEDEVVEDADVVAEDTTEDTTEETKEAK